MRTVVRLLAGLGLVAGLDCTHESSAPRLYGSLRA